MLQRRNLLRSALFAPFIITTPGLLMRVKPSFDGFDVEAELLAYRKAAIAQIVDLSTFAVYRDDRDPPLGYGRKFLFQALNAQRLAAAA